VYEPGIPKEQTQRQIVTDLMRRAFDGSATGLVLGALSVHPASAKELEEIKALLGSHERKKAR
jgi:predicted transcriptional regulator